MLASPWRGRGDQGPPEDAMSLEQMSTSLRTTPSGTTRRTKLSS